MSALSATDDEADVLLGVAMERSLIADLALGKALCEFQSLNVQLRHLASWRMRYPDDKGTVVAIRRCIERAQSRVHGARMAFASTVSATEALVRELSQTAGVCVVCMSPASRGICDDCDSVLSEPSF